MRTNCTINCELGEISYLLDFDLTTIILQCKWRVQVLLWLQHGSQLAITWRDTILGDHVCTRCLPTPIAPARSLINTRHRLLHHPDSISQSDVEKSSMIVKDILAWMPYAKITFSMQDCLPLKYTMCCQYVQIFPYPCYRTAHQKQYFWSISHTPLLEEKPEHHAPTVFIRSSLGFLRGDT